MKTKMAFAIFTLLIFISGLFAGSYVGVVGASTSMSSQLYAGGQTMHAALISLQNNDIEKAKNILCLSIGARINILAFTLPFLSDRQTTEVSQLKHAWLSDDFKKQEKDLKAVCD